MSYEAITFERRGHVAVVTMNRPDTLNAVNTALHHDLRTACREIEKDDEVRVMILTGAGRGFCSARTWAKPAARRQTHRCRRRSSGWMSSTGGRISPSTSPR